MNHLHLNFLIAEDNEADVYLVREALNAAGLNYQMSVASNGEEAVAAVEQAARSEAPKFDAIILDLNLTTHSGLDILEQIRATRCLDGLRVIVLTSSESPSDQQQANSLGTDLYIRKPMELEEFMQIGVQIANLLENGRVGEAVR